MDDHAAERGTLSEARASRHLSHRPQIDRRVPERRNYNDDGNIWWSPVATEWSELGLGAYAVRRASVSGVWHAVTGPPSKPWSLYDLITKRSSNILTDPTLRDAAVDLGSMRKVA